MLVCFLLKRTSGPLNSKDFLRVFLMTRATKKEQATASLKTNSMNSHVEYKQGFRTICNGIWQKSQQLQFAEILLILHEYFNYASQKWMKKCQSWLL